MAHSLSPLANKRRICYSVPVRRCTVSIRGKDGELHSKTVDATSLFDAADEIIRDWNRLWWWSSSSLIEIESGDDHWRVSQDRVRKWRKTKAGS
jgi:hypothetical protein